MCHERKPVEDFAFRSKKTGKRQSQCRMCQAKYRRQHYLANRDSYVRREVERIESFRRTNRLRLLEYLRSHPCVDCGENDPVVLEFDHRDPETKRDAVTAIAARKPWKFVVCEIAKCDVRCVNCHRRRTAEQFKWVYADAAVSTAHAAAQRAAVSVPAEVLPTVTRRCTMCGSVRPIAEFAMKDRRTGRRDTRCRACVAARSRAHYEQNREICLARGKAAKRAYRSRNRVRKAEVLLALECVDCGATDPRILDFDHRDRTAKRAEVSRLMSSGSWSLIVAEIAKCDVRCANCHRRRTAEDLGWIRSRLSGSDDRTLVASPD
jgi:hypothetical protein